MEEKKFLDLNGLKIVVNNIENEIDGNNGTYLLPMILLMNRQKKRRQVRNGYVS